MKIPTLLLIPILALPLAGASRGATPDPLGWMAGCWELRRGDRVVEEQWMRPGGGMMLGISRTVVRDTAREWEHLSIRRDGDALVYRSLPSGQPAAEFRASDWSEDAVVFENPAHDFPQRILYRHASGGDSLLARIEGTIDGGARGVDFPYARAPCPGGENGWG